MFLHCTDTSPADWLRQPESRFGISGILYGPYGFEAYAQSPLSLDPNDQEGSGFTAYSDSQPLRAAKDVLCRHTQTPNELYFMLLANYYAPLSEEWTAPMPPDGFESDPLPPLLPESIIDGPRVRHVVRSYYLFKGTCAKFHEWRDWSGIPTDGFLPSKIWPADHAWCLSSDIDQWWFGVAASERAMQELERCNGVDIRRVEDPFSGPDWLRDQVSNDE